MRIDFIKQKDVEHAEIMVNCSCWDDIKECVLEVDFTLAATSKPTSRRIWVMSFVPARSSM